MAAASAVMLETGRQLNDAVSYLEKVSGGNALPGFEAEPAKPTIFITPKQFNEWQVESLPISEEIDNKLITYVENYKTDLEGFSTLPEDALKAGNILLSKKADVTQLEVGNYESLAKRSIKDGLTPDHIPSFAAVKKAAEIDSGGVILSRKDRQKLYKSSNCLVYDTKLH